MRLPIIQNTTILQALGFLLFLTVALMAMFYSLNRPYLNWDMIAYVAAAKSFEERDIHALHSFTYDSIQASVPPGVFDGMITGPYRNAVWADVSAFEEQLPFYQIRPVYNGLIYLLYKGGVDIGLATYLISGVSVATGIVMIFLIARRWLALPFLFALPILALIFGIIDVARYSTPDGLALLSMVIAVILYLEKRHLWLLWFFPMMIGVRTDLILFVFPFLFFLLLSGELRKGAVFVGGAIVVLTYLAIGIYWGNPGWSTIFYFTLVEILTHPLTVAPVLEWGHYWSAFRWGLEELVLNKPFLLYVVVVGGAGWVMWSRFQARGLGAVLQSREMVLSGVGLAFVVTHFLAFPVIWDRFFTGAYLIGTLAFFMGLSGNLQGGQERARFVGRGKGVAESEEALGSG